MTKSKVFIAFSFCLIGWLFCSCGQQSSSPSETVVITNPTFDFSKTTTVAITYEAGGVVISSTQEIVSNQVIVTLASGKNQGDLEALLSGYGATVVGRNSMTGAYQIQLSSGLDPVTTAGSFSASSVIASAGTNPICLGELIPDDEDYSLGSDPPYNWALKAISAEAAWEITTGESTDKIAVVDTGLYRGQSFRTDEDKTKYKNEMEDGRLVMLALCDRIDNDADPINSTDSHAVNVMSVFAAKGNNQNYSAGMNWHCKIYPIRASAGASGAPKVDFQTYINALAYAIDNGVKVINCSNGEFLSVIWNLPTVLQFKSLAAEAQEKGSLLVCSAGNSGKDAQGHYPSYLSASYDSVISVGGVDAGNARYIDDVDTAKGSNYGSYVDIAAPGKRIFVLDNPVSTTVTGTSVAAPFVAGTASLMFSLAAKEGYALTPAETKTILKSSSYTDAISTDHPVGRKLNAYKALLGALALSNRGVIAVSSNVDGAAIYLSYNSGRSYSDTGKTTSTQEAKRLVVAAGSSYEFKVKLVKSGYDDAFSSLISGIAAGAEVDESIAMTASGGTTTTTTTLTTTTLGQFSKATVDSSGMVGGDTSIALYNNKDYIVYGNSWVSDLKYATNASGSWVADNTIDSAGVLGQYSSLAIDSSGYLHVSYINSTNKNLLYATNKSGSWVKTTIYTNALFNNSIAIDASGYVHISFASSSPDYDLMYATNASGSWVVTAVDSGSDVVGSYNALALDSSGEVYISYYDTTNEYLRYATNKSGSWVSTRINDAGSVGTYNDIGVDSSGNVYISYYDATNKRVSMADNRGGVWTATPIDATGSYEKYTVLALDSNNKVHICYEYVNSSGFSSLRYVTNKSGAWSSPVVVDSSGGESVSIALDGNNKAHMSYKVQRAGGYKDLKYAVEN